MKIVICSLGCKVNQYEADCVANKLLSFGYDVSFQIERAEVYILNTCAVTNEAERKSRGMVAKFNKLNPNCKIFVCGCASEHNKQQFEKINNVTFVMGNGGKNGLADYIHNTLNGEPGYINHSMACFDVFSHCSSSRTRANLKIQDGCNNFCSYCLIPFVRGRSRSRNIQEIVNEAIELSKQSKEIVLTGINISDFRVDNKLALKELMLKLSNINARIRIGSLEVNIITDDFLKVVKQCKNFCPHFHLSMQSGCDRILKLMNRKYTKNEYLEKVDLIRKYFPLACITTDVICGFPTETDADFLETYETIKKADFYFMHIFPYSTRDGTKAAGYEKVSSEVSKARCKVLSDTISSQRKKYFDKLNGIVQNVITEEFCENYTVGHTEYYVKCYIEGRLELNENYKVELIDAYKDGAIAKVVKKP